MSHKAFTLIELLASLVLTSLLMVAVSNLLGIVGRRTEAILLNSSDDYWKDVFIERLRWELDNTHTWRMSPKILQLTGYLSVDRRKHQATMTEATVTYQVVEDGKRSWLLRTFQERHSLNNLPPVKELICQSVQRFQLFLPSSGEPLDQMSGTLPKSFELRFLDARGAEIIRSRHYQ